MQLKHTTRLKAAHQSDANNMKRKLTREEKIQRGKEAARLLEHPLYKETIETLKEQIVQGWATAPARDHEGKELLWNLFQATTQFEQIFQSYITNAKVELDLQQREKARDIASRRRAPRTPKSG